MGQRLRRVIWGDFELACLRRISSLVCIAGLLCLAIVTRVHAEDLAKAGEAPSHALYGEVTAGFVTLLTLLVRSWARRKGRGMPRQGSSVDAFARGRIEDLTERVERMSESATRVRVDQATAMQAMENRLGLRIDYLSADISAARSDVATTLERHHKATVEAIRDALLPREKPEPAPAPEAKER
jgi:hypothetical protein